MINGKSSKPEGTDGGCCGSQCCGGMRKWIFIALAVVLSGVLLAHIGGRLRSEAPASDVAAAAARTAETTSGIGIPRLLDLGASECMPCKMMKPILDDLSANYADSFQTDFVDVWVNPAEGKKYGISAIPTQIFFDATGKELFRHEGFLGKEEILAKWRELGIEMAAPDTPPPVSRWTPASPDTRAKEEICYLCDGDIAEHAAVVVKTDKGDVRLCSMHHYFVMYTSLTEDKTDFEDKVSVADWATGASVPIRQASFVYGMEKESGRPTVKAFADGDAAEAERRTSGGDVLDLAKLQSKELANRCGFCDRAVYPEDASEVLVGGVKTWGCCSHCALGVAARTGQDIEVRERDRLSGAPVVVKTLEGSVASLDPSTAVAWYGQRVKPDGTHASAGCFHQGFFENAANLSQWLEANPLETGEQITIAKALKDKMALTPLQISKACKIGECAPK